MIYSADELHKLSEVQTNFHWDAEFTGPPFDKYVEPLKKRVISSTLPTYEHQIGSVTLCGQKIIVPGVVSYSGTITLTFFEGVKFEVYQMMSDWAKAVSNRTDDDVTGEFKSFEDVWGTVKLVLQNKRDEKTREVTLHNCLLTSVDSGGMLDNGTSPDYLRPTLTLSYGF